MYKSLGFVLVLLHWNSKEQVERSGCLHGPLRVSFVHHLGIRRAYYHGYIAKVIIMDLGTASFL